MTETLLEKCPCGAELPNHLLGLVNPLTHICRCHRKFRGVSGGWKHIGFERNPTIKLEAVKFPDHRGDYTAPPGHIFLCGACGKVSRTFYGLDGNAQSGWDESCMLNAVLMKAVG